MQCCHVNAKSGGKSWSKSGEKTAGMMMGLILAWVMVGLSVGCAFSQKQQGKGQAKPSSSAQATARQDASVEDDPTDPTAMMLHDLAGKILLFQVTHRRLPATLEEFAGPSDVRAGTGGGIDPATRRLFIYTPQSPINPRLPGRVILNQPLSQGARGRWALLINDLASDGRIVTYVQRVPEMQLPRMPASP